jgi:hypothetical protein
MPVTRGLNEQLVSPPQGDCRPLPSARLAELELFVEHDDLEVDARRKAPEELPVGLVVLLDEVVRAGALDRPGADPGSLRDLARDVAGSHVLECLRALRLVEQMRSVVRSRGEHGAGHAELGLERRHFALNTLVRDVASMASRISMSAPISNGIESTF